MLQSPWALQNTISVCVLFGFINLRPDVEFVMDRASRYLWEVSENLRNFSMIIFLQKQAKAILGLIFTNNFFILKPLV